MKPLNLKIEIRSSKLKFHSQSGYYGRSYSRQLFAFRCFLLILFNICRCTRPIHRHCLHIEVIRCDDITQHHLHNLSWEASTKYMLGYRTMT